MKKKILSLCLVMALAAVAVVGGTLAYFTDTDSAKNVMTTGDVSIIQNEKERNEDGELVDFTDGKPLYPAVGDNNGDGKLDVPYDDAGNKMFSNDRNVVDKIITVTNNGTNDAYVRTLIAFEIPEAPADFAGATLTKQDENGDVVATYVDVVNVAPYLFTVMKEGATAGKSYTLPQEANGDYVIIEVDNVAYLVTEYYYKNDSKLTPSEESHQSLVQIYLSSEATNEDAALVVGADGNYNILAVSQGVQTMGFNDAKTALDTAFGEVNAENCAEWFATVE